MLTTKLVKLADGVVMASPSPRVRVLFHNLHGSQHTICYLGFTSQESAQQCYQYLLRKVGGYQHSRRAGICKPRKAERVENMTYEIKWHSPDVALLNQAITRDLERHQLVAA